MGLTSILFFSTFSDHAEVVELVDTLASGASGGNPVEVRVLFSVHLNFLALHLIKTFQLKIHVIFQ